MSKRIDNLDVICQISHDGTVIPMRIRTPDDEGELQTYNVKEYRQINHDSQIVKDDGIDITYHTLVFDCRIQVFDQLRPVRLYFNTQWASWFIRNKHYVVGAIPSSILYTLIVQFGYFL